MRRAELVSVPLVPVRETFSVGSALSRSLSIWKRNLVFFLGVAFIAVLPTLPELPYGGSRWALWWAALVLGLTVRNIAEGIVAYSVLEQLRGRTPPAVEALARGWSKAGALFAATLFTSCLIAGAALAFIVPGIILAVRWVLLSQVVVAEGEVDPRARSAEITAGHRWAIFGLMVLYVLANVIASVALAAVIGRFLSAGPTKIIGNLVSSTLTLSFSAVLYSVVYYQLRSEKEGIDIEQLTSVFQ